MSPQPSDPTTRARAFLQDRVALFGKIGLAFGLAGSVADLGMSPETALRSWYPALVFGNVVPMAALWLLCRKGARTVRFVRTAEFTCLLIFATSYSLTGRYGIALTLPGVPAGIELSGLAGLTFGDLTTLVQTYITTMLVFAMTFTLVTRAAIVPSRGKHTFVLTLTAGLPLLVLTALGVFPVDTAAVVDHKPDRVLTTATAGVWWAFTTAVCTVISAVIYGLRREVRAAQQLGQYVLESKLGEGGMGVVYRARHAMMRRPTALKLLPPEKAGAADLARFEREVQQTARLTHPNTITVYDYGRTPDGIFYYAMELLDGVTVQRVVEADGAQPAARVVHILSAMACALEEAHGIGLIHRDVKPANVMLCDQGGERDVAKLLDFGLVKQLTTDAQQSGDHALRGTPLYMAPESIEDPDSAGPASDLYALGAVGYYLLTGQHVFSGATIATILAHHLHSEPIPPAQRLGRAVPEDLADLILACLAKDPAARPAPMAAFRKRLQACACAGQWTQASARDWWERHRSGLTQVAEPLGTDDATTVALGRRTAP